ncbi:PREDICTED: aminoacyl tRNA synthase complex-interacting multifunctional protein 2-like [Priapulus caudatus]|uniref:Aminoacyl tRNA synthase complex-interacting multifunctional protein 2-like n=1 Tax=Priapulus caudatus TaxID=37621 RepID=A0ABM1EDK4_PRICU|nr:PREDICTED: aminoacyl tRNA synthase complex-interacting multifunctional protein 2-like [Priapulus caudatus]
MTINTEPAVNVDMVPAVKQASCESGQFQHDPIDSVITMNPARPALSALVICQLLRSQEPVNISTHTHSNVTMKAPDLTATFGGNGLNLAAPVECGVRITLVWKNVERATLMASPQARRTVHGESNICRYLARHLPMNHDRHDAVTATEVDQWIDTAAALTAGSKKEIAAVVRSLNARLGANAWLAGGDMSVADVVMWGSLYRAGQVADAPNNVKKWIKSCEVNPAFASVKCLA